MSKTLDLIRNAKDGSYIDFRTADNQIDSVPIAEIRALLADPFAIEPILTPKLAIELTEKYEVKFMIIEA